MGVVTVPLGFPARVACALAMGCLVGSRAGQAFPITDPDNPSIVTSAPQPSESDLRHQLQLQSGFGAAEAGGGWTFVPAVTFEEIWTDNILNTETNRRWDLISALTPSISIYGDVPNAQVQFNYSPVFFMAARTPQENRITNQLAGTGLFTIIPDEFYVDARAFAGSSPVGGGFGPLGNGFTTLNGVSGFGGVGTTGLSKQNEVQTSSFSLSPYWLHRFSDTGTAKVGYQFNESAYSQGGTYLPLFFPTGSNSAYNFTNEGVAQFETGERFAPFRNFTSADARIGTGNGFNGDSSQYTFVNRLGYLVNRNVSVFGELGYEDLNFTGVTPNVHINDVVWGIGTTLTPNTDSQITVSFGHQNGENSANVNGWYQLTERTRISARYATGLQTDLQGISNQLDLLSLDSTGMGIDSQSGAPLFIGNNGLGVQAGLFRTKSLSMNATTVLDRDSFSLSLQYYQTTTVATVRNNVNVPFGVIVPPVGTTSTATTGYVTWAHQISEDLSMSTSVAYGTSHFSSGSSNQQSLATSVAVQYLISQTLAASARYSFFDRISTTPGQSYYQNLVLVGLTKQF
jgi:uncharacterized protein (PEP-CTERM system associated)